MRTMGFSRRVFSDTSTQIFAKVANFPLWRPKKKKVFTAFPRLRVETKASWHCYSAHCVCLVKHCGRKGTHPSSRENPEWFLETSATPLKPPLSAGLGAGWFLWCPCWRLKILVWLGIIHAVTRRSCAGHVSIGASPGVPLWHSRVPEGDLTCELYCRL